MLLAIDVGNSNVKFGLFEDDNLVAQWRIRTQVGRTSDEYASLLHNLFAYAGHSFGDVTGCAITSVVPRSTPDVAKFCADVIGISALVVDSSTNLGIEILYSPPSDVGPDRLVDCVAALKLYSAPCIVVDCGTGTTLNAIVSARSPGFDAAYLGGAICPGIGISLEALFARAAKLSAVEIALPDSAIGSNTKNALQSGVIYGFAGQIDALVGRFRNELGIDQCPVIATGGHMNSHILAASNTITHFDPLLTLHGLRLTYLRSRDNLS